MSTDLFFTRSRNGRGRSNDRSGYPARHGATRSANCPCRKARGEPGENSDRRIRSQRASRASP